MTQIRSSTGWWCYPTTAPAQASQLVSLAALLAAILNQFRHFELALNFQQFVSSNFQFDSPTSRHFLEEWDADSAAIATLY